MSKRKQIMLVCGSGIVTSSLIMPNVEDILDSFGIKYDIIKGSVQELMNTDSSKYDCVISTLEIDSSQLNCPFVMARELLTGTASPELVEKLRSILCTDDQ